MAVSKDKKTGKWFYYGRHEDRSQYKKRGFDTKKEARIAELDYLSALEDEALDSITFEELATKYMEWYKPRRKASSYSKISGIIDAHLIPHFGNKDVSSIRTRDVMTYQTSIAGKYSGHHARKIFTTFSAVLNFGVKMEYLKENVARLVGSGDIEIKKRMDYWTLEEFKEFLKNVDDELYYALFMTLYYSGMRKGELLALTWADIDFNTNVINVDKTEYNRVVTTPKTPSSIRKIMMPKHVISLLKKLKKSAATTAPVKSNYVVFGEFFDSIPTSTLDRQYDKYIKLSGVNRIRLHDFRHSHASYLINKGTIISVVAKRLGHGDIATTLNTYSHLYPSTEIDAIEKMEDDFKTATIVKLA